MIALPPALRPLLDATEPTLAFDLATIDATLTGLAAAARANAVRVVFAVKAFPHPAVIELAAARLDGLDVAGPDERAAAAAVGASGVAARMISITDPALDPATVPAGPGVTVTCETADQIRAVRAARPDAAIALRLSMSAVAPDDPGVGALQAGDGHRRSRFGIEPDDLRELAAAARGARLGLHVHSAGVVPTSPARWAAIARAVIAIAERGEVAPAFVDLGGSWHGVAGELAAALAAVRAAVPAAIEVVIEPGRLVSLGAGYAIGRIAAARRLADRELRVTTLSRIAHLRWSAVELIAGAPAPGAGGKVTFAGATCFEDDVIGDWIVDDPLPVGAAVAWAGVTGYSVAWNRGFAGVPPARVIVARR